MTSAGEARDFIRLHCRKQVGIRGVDRSLFERAGAQVTMQTFPVVVRFIKANGVMGFAEILDVDVVQPIQLGAESAKHRIVSVAGVTGLVGRDAMVLKVRGGEVSGVIQIQAATVRLHDVAGEAERGVLGSFEFRRNAHGHTEQRQQEEDKECEDFPSTGCCQPGPRRQDGDQRYTESYQ